MVSAPDCTRTWDQSRDCWSVFAFSRCKTSHFDLQNERLSRVYVRRSVCSTSVPENNLSDTLDLPSMYLLTVRLGTSRSNSNSKALWTSYQSCKMHRLARYRSCGDLPS